MHLKQALKHIVFSLFTKMIPSFRATNTAALGISSVVCHDRLDMFICSAASLFFHLGMSLPIYVVSDGSLTPKDMQRLRSYFTIMHDSQTVRESKWKRRQKQYPSLVSYRLDPLNPVTKLKYDANFLSPFRKTIYMDLDVLFLQKPVELRRWITNASAVNYYLTYPRTLVESDRRSDEDYSFRRVIDTKVFPMATPSFNAGLVCISDKQSINLELLDKVFHYFNSIGYSRSFMAEETAMAIVFRDKTCRSLPLMSYVCVARHAEYDKIDVNAATAIHFINGTEDKYIHHAAKQLIATRAFRVKT